MQLFSFPLGNINTQRISRVVTQNILIPAAGPHPGSPAYCGFPTFENTELINYECCGLSDPHLTLHFCSLGIPFHSQRNINFRK